MPLKLRVRYQIDLSVIDPVYSSKEKKSNHPIGQLQEYSGTLENIKKKICEDLDLVYAECKKLYNEG